MRGRLTTWVLENFARRIRARAARRCGELCKISMGAAAIEAKVRPLSLAPPSRREAAREAGLSEHKARTAVRLAAIDVNDFEAEIEKEPAGTTVLAQLSRKQLQAERGDRIDTFETAFLGMDQTHCSARVIEALLKLERQIDACDLGLTVQILSSQDVKNYSASAAPAPSLSGLKVCSQRPAFAPNHP